MTPMRYIIIISGVLALIGLTAVMILSPLHLFNFAVPFDSGSSRVAAGIAYGAGPRRLLDVYRPSTNEQNLPVIVFSYGGGWDSGDRSGYAFAGHALAARGFVVVVYDYRLVPEVRFPAFVDDTAGAVAWSLRNAAAYGGSGDQVFLVGHSAGAYNVALTALDGRFLARAGVDGTAIAGVAALAGPFDFLPLSGPATVAAFSSWPNLAETQPVNAVTPDAPPFLLVTGDADSTVYPRNSEALAKRLTEAGVPNRLVLYAGLGHAALVLALSRPLRWRAPVLDDVESFFKTIAAQRPAANSP